MERESKYNIEKLIVYIVNSKYIIFFLSLSISLFNDFPPCWIYLKPQPSKSPLLSAKHLLPLLPTPRTNTNQIPTMSDHQYKFNVTMTCGGCSGAVERVLKKLEGKRYTCFIVFSILTRWSLGVKTFDVSLETQTVNVTTEPTLSYDNVLEKIKKTGKTVNSGEADGESKEV